MGDFCGLAVGVGSLASAKTGFSVEDAAVLYSMMGCCKAADVDFKVWMNYFLSHVHDYDTDYTKDLTDLLPEALKKTEESAGIIKPIKILLTSPRLLHTSPTILKISPKML